MVHGVTTGRWTITRDAPDIDPALLRRAAKLIASRSQAEMESIARSAFGGMNNHERRYIAIGDPDREDRNHALMQRVLPRRSGALVLGDMHASEQDVLRAFERGHFDPKPAVNVPEPLAPPNPDLPFYTKA